jgi:chromosome segregation ATPase
MRKPVQFALIALIVVLGGATAVLYSKYRKTTADYLDTKSAEETARNRYAQTIDAIAEIQDSLNAISVGENEMVSKNLQSEQKLSPQQGQEALDRIAVLRSSISRNKERILQLESSLKKSGVRVSGLEKLVKNLKTDVADKETQVAQLTTQVNELQTQVTGLTTEVAQTQDTLRVRDETLEDRRRELATVYYVVGSKKDLTDAGVVEAKGGVLGLGKTLTPSGYQKEGLFTALDTDQETVVRTNSAKVKVVSAQPTTSYEITTVNGQAEIHILDPLAFRKVKQLVIVTA